MKRGFVVPFVFLTACGANAPKAGEPQPSAVTSPVIWKGDEYLAPILTQPQLNAVVLSNAERIEAQLGAGEFARRLGVVVEDSAAPWLVRLNALELLANSGVPSELPAFVTALRASDERIRIAAAAGLGEYLNVRPRAATEILIFALRDPSPRVQTAALQTLGDRDINALRDFLARTQNKDLRIIATDFIRAAEERGAALVPDAAGNLERTTANGVEITYRPTARWPEWDASIGDLVVAVRDEKPVTIASGVEVVANVVPAFVTADGRTLVYEIEREIRTRDLATGADKKLADGIAPRILPFSNDVIFFREIRDRRTMTPNSVNMTFEVHRIPVAGGTAKTLGQIATVTMNNIKGNYVPLRWMHIEERAGIFVLVGDRMNPFQLPNPFGA